MTLRTHTRTAALLLLGIGLGGVASGGSIDAGRGTVDVVVPSSYQPGQPTPLVLLLHGYSSSGATLEATLGLTPLAEDRGFLYAHPDGTMDAVTNRFWNATDGCCDLFGAGPDDVAYLDALLDEIALQWSIDPERTFLVGHSNGGFMAYRFACEHADRVAGIASLAGATWLDPLDCSPTLPVRTLQLHGDSDGVIFYGGGQVPLMPSTYPGAIETTETWADYNGCSSSFETLPPLDLIAGLSGDETTVRRYRDGCDSTSFYSELWTVAGHGHSPTTDDALPAAILDFLFGSIFSDGFESGDTGAWSAVLP